MNIHDALSRATLGKGIQRMEWSVNKSLWEQPNGELFIYSRQRSGVVFIDLWVPTSSEILANDWQVVSEQPLTAQTVDR
jgi:hypothetical protein